MASFETDGLAAQAAQTAQTAQTGSDQTTQRKRTAVLVVHGIGSQRALETVRGVVDAVWLQNARDPASDKPPRQVWIHPQRSGIDIDLSVITTSGLSMNTSSGPEKRSIDFHELYWAHLMSETRAVAVVLWLFELVRKGPRLKPRMRALWWVSAVFLCVVIASIVLVVLHLVGRLASVDGRPATLALAPIFALFVLSASALISSFFSGAWKLFSIFLLPTVAIFTAFYLGIKFYDLASHYSTLYLAPALSVLVALIAMGRWGALVMALTFAVASASVPVYFWVTDTQHPSADWGAWSLAETWSSVAACFMIVIYFAFNSIFLQSFLGDAARYFRNSPGNVAVRREIRKQAVDTLAALHTSGIYDRIIVVAHSLGSVVAYDMLRANFSSICSNLPDLASDPTFKLIDGLDPDPAKRLTEPAAFKRAGRDLVGEIAKLTVGNSHWDKKNTSTWLVTDFVTLGAALTHAHYLMCKGDTEAELVANFKQRVKEREFPTCPPAMLDSDGRLSFPNPRKKGQREFHHAALFGMTSWTNLYFPMKQLLWGDPIGGPLADLFGADIADGETWTTNSKSYQFFTHTAYWDIKRAGGRRAPHIQKLIEAVDLKDRDLTPRGG